MTYQYLSPENLKSFIQSALAEDVGDGDHSTLASIPAKQQGKAKLLVKSNGIVAGVELAEIIFKLVDANMVFSPSKQDGDPMEAGEIAFFVEGNVRTLLTCERLVLNCMQRMSGIATYTKRLGNMVAHTQVKLLDTRKTTPNFRIPEKWAVKIGGGENHRFGLFDMVMLKDNHIDFAGGVAQAILKTQQYLQSEKRDLKIEVEARTLQDVETILNTGGVFRVLLDNMEPEMVKQAVRLVDRQIETEASGGITEHNLVEMAETGVDYISLGALTHSAKSLDLSLKAC
jgi:nicotinate-nucleotide pyrophosphorylase (carboxylating)